MTLIAERETPTAEAPAEAPVEAAEQRRPRRLHPSQIGLIALALALIGFLLAVLVFYGLVDWYLPIFAIGPAIGVAASALTQHVQRKTAAIAALVISAIALMPPTASLALAGYAGAQNGDPGLSGTADTSTFDALQRLVTGDDAAGTGTDGANGTGTTGTGTTGANGQNGADGTDGTSGTDGTNGSNGTDGTDGTDGTTGTGTNPQTGTPIIDVSIGGGGTAPTTPAAPIIAVDTSGIVGDLLTTSTGLQVKVGSVSCGLPLVSVLGISINLGGSMCAVNVSVTNTGTQAVAINSGSLTGVSGGVSILGDLGIGTTPLSTTVAAGASVNGNLYVKVPSTSSTLSRLELRLGGELLKVQVG